MSRAPIKLEPKSQLNKQSATGKAGEELAGLARTVRLAAGLGLELAAGEDVAEDRTGRRLPVSSSSVSSQTSGPSGI